VTFPGGAADTVEVAIVPDFSRFPAELRRGVDSAMRELATRVDLAMSGIEHDAAGAARSVGVDFQAGGEVAEHAFRELELTASRNLHVIDAQTTATAAGMSAKFTSAAAVAGAALLGFAALATAGLGALTVMGVKAAATMEQTQIQFKSLLGSAELGNKVLRDLQQFAAATPFEFLDIAPVAARFFNLAEVLGMAKTQVVEFLTVVGNIASVTGGGAFAMERVAFAMGQIASKGRLSAQDLNQIGDALVGFNVRAGIAAELGMSAADTMKAMEAGTIDAQTGLRALMAAMAKFPGAAGAMEAQSQTLIGLFSTFKDTVKLALIDAFTPVIPEIKLALAGVTPIIGDAVKALAPVLGGLLTALLKLLGPLIKVFAVLLAPLVKALGEAIDNIDPRVWEQLTLAMAQLAEALVPLIPLLVEFLIGTLEIAIPLVLLLAQVLKLLAPVFNFITDAIHEFNRAMAAINWAEVGRAIADFFVDLWGHIAGFFSDVGAGIAVIPEAFRRAFQGMVDIGVAKINQLVGFIRALPGRVLTAVGNLGTLLVSAGRDVVVGLWNGMKSMTGWITDHVRGFIRLIIEAGKRALGISSPSRVMADEVGKWIPPGIGMGIEAAMPGLRAQLAGIGAQVPAAAGAGGGTSGGVMLGPGAVVLNFHGAAPTPQQAYNTGIQAGKGIMDAIERRSVATAVKQHA
jgi:tape measure domain-containing protein